MERIKQAIENAKKPEVAHAARHGTAHVHSQYARHNDAGHGTRHAVAGVRWDIVKYAGAMVLIVFAGWLWMRLDFMNKLELAASEFIHDGIKQARAESKRRQEEEEKFRQVVNANLIHCQEAAERDKESYMALAQKEVRITNKNSFSASEVKFIIPRAALAEAARMLQAAKAECQLRYETQLNGGK